MKCPACGENMVQKDFGGIIVDVCESGCSGVWFDWFELSKLDESNEGFGPELQSFLRKDQMLERTKEHIKCPKCGIPMHVHKYQSSKKVIVDECYACGGFFLDAGELSQIRKSFMTEGEEASYISKLVDGMPEFAVAQDDLQKKKMRTRAINGFTKHLRFKK